jgi:hypothetical protein
MPVGLSTPLQHAHSKPPGSAAGHGSKLISKQFIQAGACVTRPRETRAVSVIGLLMANWPSHSLTTLQQPVDQMIMKATELLMTQIHQTDTKPEHITLSVTPMLRSSTRRLPRCPEDS